MEIALTLVRIGLFIALAVAYTTVGWLVRRHWHDIGLAVFWLVSSAIFGYSSFRVVCSHPVTCDVGPDPYAIYYLTHVGRFYTFIGALGFAGAGLVVALRSRRPGPLRGLDVILGTVATVVGWTAGGLLAPAFLSW